MFGRKDAPEAAPEENTNQSPIAARAAGDQAMRHSPAAPVPARRPTHDLSAHGKGRALDRGNDTGERKLTVGKGLSLSGEITACDVLVVEGKVEAKLTDGKLLEITESGQFRGSVEIENADIAGRYDGELIVHGRLTLRGTGRISGMIKYGELEVNAGGQIIGELQVVGGATAAATGPHAHGPGGHSFKSAAKFTAQTDDDDGDLISRKAS